MTDRKVIVVTGCRDWTNEPRVRSALLEEGGRYLEVIMFHGACPTGADDIARQIADEMGFFSHACPPDWDKHGKAAGPRRNGIMCRAAKTTASLEHADIKCIAFWDGQSRGTLNCISQATALGIPVLIVPQEK
jgi:hypothetical protein